MVSQSWIRTIAVIIIMCVFMATFLFVIKIPEPDTSSVQLTVFNSSGEVIEPMRRESDSAFAPEKWYPIGDNDATRLEVNADWLGDSEAIFSGRVTYQLVTEFLPRGLFEVVLVVNFTVTGSAYNDTRLLVDLLPDEYDEWHLEIVFEVEGWSASNISCFYREEV